jgi:hypothetical protein
VLNALTEIRCCSCGRQLGTVLPVVEPVARPRQAEKAVDFLVPTNVSRWALASCYLGLVGFLLPLCGFFFAVPAVLCGIMALRNRPAGGSYNAVTGNLRAIIGLTLGGLGVLVWGSLLLLFLLNQ